MRKNINKESYFTVQKLYDNLKIFEQVYYQLLFKLTNYNHGKQTILLDIRFEIIAFCQRPKVNRFKMFLYI